jgi:radical SAM superfamily enzyme YgiQ (UPF0313 family)
MKVLLISANTEKVSMATMPVGLACVATAVRQAGHETSFLDLMSVPDAMAAIQESIAEFSPDVIGISVRNIDDQSMQSPRFMLEQVRPVIKGCRDCTSVPIVLGGAAYSLLPGEVLEYLDADFGIIGDGEVAFPMLLDKLLHKQDPSLIPGVVIAGQARYIEPVFPENMGLLPLPEEELWKNMDPNDFDLWVPVQSRRGCPNDCSYCATFLIQGRKIRTRSPLSVVQHIAHVASYGFRKFYFVDNSFNIPESYALDLCHHLRSLKPKVSWRCILYPHHVKEELVRQMAEAGCIEVSLGFESGSNRILHEMNKRFSPEEVRQISELLAAYNIRRMGFLLLGGPGETRDTVEESIAFAESLHLDQLRTTVGIRIYAGTPLAQRARQDGLITPDDTLLLPRFYLAPVLKGQVVTFLLRM